MQSDSNKAILGHLYDVPKMKRPVRAGPDSIRDLQQLFSIHTVRIRLEIPIAYLFYSCNNFWQLPWQLSSSLRSPFFLLEWKNISPLPLPTLHLLLLLLEGFCFCLFWMNSHSLPAEKTPATADQFSTCLSAICQVFFPLKWSSETKRKPLVSFFPSISLIFQWSHPLLLNSVSLFLQILQPQPELRIANCPTERSSGKLLVEGRGVRWSVARCDVRCQSSCQGAGGKGRPVVRLAAFDR